MLRQAQHGVCLFVSIILMCSCSLDQYKRYVWKCILKMSSRRVSDLSFAAPACICLLVTLAATSITAASVRGAPPHLLSHYDTNVDTFRCLDGSKSITRSRVNDDYCDCLDGSDEPGLATQLLLLLQRAQHALTGCYAGTSACSNGQFYCRNRGHQPLLLNASFVDDGICGKHPEPFSMYYPGHAISCCKLSYMYTDCCDGTDEAKGCKNTCRAAGSAARQDLVSKTKEYTAGVKTRQKYISQSQANKAQWKLELLRVQKDISVQQGITDQAKGWPL